MKTKKILSVSLTLLLVLGIILSPMYLSAPAEAVGGPMISLLANRIFAKYLIGTGVKMLIEQAEQKQVKWTVPEGYGVDAFDINGTLMELTYAEGEKPDKAILQLHGGAYILPFSDVYRRIAVQYVKVSKAAVLSVDYRVAPKHTYPKALEDAISGYNWLLENGYSPENIIVVGDSAGGGLTLALAMYLRDNNLPVPKALILMAPWVDLDSAKPLSEPYVGENDYRDPYISPFFGTFDSLPPMLLQVGDADSLLESNLEFAEKAKADGAEILTTVYKGMGHVFQLDFPSTQESIDSWDEIEEFIKATFAL